MKERREVEVKLIYRRERDEVDRWKKRMKLMEIEKMGKEKKEKETECK